jgi:hypothetical protein
MGHSNISITSKVYTHASTEALETARQLINMGNQVGKTSENVQISTVANGLAVMRSGVRTPYAPPKKVGNFDRNCLPFHFARKPLISGLFRYPAIKSSRYGVISAAAFLLFRVFPAPLSRTNRSHRGVLFNLRGIVLTEGNRSI